MCGSSCYPVIGMSVVLKFDNLQYEGSTMCWLVIRGCLPHCHKSLFCRFYRGVMSLPDVDSRLLAEGFLVWEDVFCYEDGVFNL